MTRAMSQDPALSRDAILELMADGRARAWSAIAAALLGVDRSEVRMIHVRRVKQEADVLVAEGLLLHPRVGVTMTPR